MKSILVGLFTVSFLMFACQNSESDTPQSEVKVVSAMKNVMWKGELKGKVQLDTLSDRTGLYGIGPLASLRGELLINNGKSYVSTVAADSSMEMREDFEVAAPFFVYANATDWKKQTLPDQNFDLKLLEKYLFGLKWRQNEPYVFKLIGEVESAQIHIQNLAPGSIVTSPKEAHAGQVKYDLGKEKVELIGFFSTTHQGVFVHHDSYTHIHLMTQDEQQMGHLDAVQFKGKEMKLMLAK
ncbi:MAG: acetolactate decarboxylase [Bacteroidota bacterium]